MVIGGGTCDAGILYNRECVISITLRADDPGGFKVKDASGQSLAYVYGRETGADIAKVLTMDEARRIASNIDQSYSARAR